MDIESRLRATKKQTLLYFDLSPEVHGLTYSPGKWNIRQLLNHITDAETVLYDRIRRIIAEQPNPLVWSFDQDGWARHLDYDHFPLHINKHIFAAVRDSIIYLTGIYYEDHGSLPFVHSQTGARTLKDEIDKVAWHCRHHLDQIEHALQAGPIISRVD